MDNTIAVKPTRRKFLATAGAATAATVVAGSALPASQDAVDDGTDRSASRKAAIFDAHSHMLMAGDSMGTERRSVSDLKEISIPDLLAKMDELGIERIVSVVQETRRIWKDWTGSNDLIIDLQEKYPDRFIGIFGAEPLDDRSVLNRKRLQQFKAAVKDHGIKGLWFGPPYGHFHANDKRVYPFYEVALEHDVAVYFHHGGGIGGGGGRASAAPLKYARAILLDDVIIDFPGLRINIEHMAYPWTEELFAIIKHAENMYTDVCELFTRPTILAWYIMMAKEYGVIDKIIWGTDYDIYWYDDYDFSGYIRKVKKETSWIRNDLNRILAKSGWPTLTQREIDGIVCDNAKRLLKIGSE